MNRRGFLVSLAGGLIAAPAIEEIERLGWKRRFFPGWSPISSAVIIGRGTVITINTGTSGKPVWTEINQLMMIGGLMAGDRAWGGDGNIVERSSSSIVHTIW